jgi:hypothetical protein
VPRVPTYDGPQVRSAPTPDVRLDARAFTGRARTIGALAAQATDIVGGIAERNLDRDSSEEAYKADANVTEAWLAADARLRQKYRGETVDGYKEEVETWWNTAVQQQGEALGKLAKDKLARTLAAKRLQALTGAAGYYEQQKEQATVLAAERSKLNTIQQALVDGRPEALATARRQVLEVNAREAARRGYGQEALAAENLRDLSALHIGAVMQLLDAPGSGAAARAYFEANKAEILADRHNGIRDALQKGEDLSRVQGAADSIMALGLAPDAAMTHVEKNYSGNDEKNIKVEVLGRYQVARAAQTEREQKSYGTALLEVEQTGRVKPSTWALLTDGHRASVLDRIKAERKAREAEANHGVKTDLSAYQEARQRILAGENFDVLVYKDRVSRGDLKQLIDMQGSRSDPNKVRRMFSDERLITEYARGQKLGQPSDAGWLAFQKIAEEALVRERDAIGRELTDVQARAVLDGLVLEGTIPGGWERLWVDKTAPRYRMTPEELARARFPQRTSAGEIVQGPAVVVPPVDREAIVQVLRKRGIPASEQNITAMFLAGQQQGPKK